MQLDDHVVIVTGGASGLGGAITRTILRRGAKGVVVVDIDEEAGKQISDELGSSVHFIAGDVSKKEIAEKAVRDAVEKYGKLTGLVNNAQATRPGEFIGLSEDDWDLAFNTGLLATRQFMVAAYEELKKTNGSVVNFASGSGIVGQPTQAAYAATKEAVRGLSRVVANEWAPDVRVNVVAPRALTEGVKGWRQAFPDMWEETLKEVPMRRFGDPEEDVAPVITFLLSDDSKYMTGQTLMADGGADKIY